MATRDVAASGVLGLTLGEILVAALVAFGLIVLGLAARLVGRAQRYSGRG